MGLWPVSALTACRTARPVATTGALALQDAPPPRFRPVGASARIAVFDSGAAGPGRAAARCRRRSLADRVAAHPNGLVSRAALFLHPARIPSAGDWPRSTSSGVSKVPPPATLSALSAACGRASAPARLPGRVRARAKPTSSGRDA
jgi:hypothetical protein